MITENHKKISAIILGIYIDVSENTENLTNFGCIKPCIVKFSAFSREYIWLLIWN